MVTNRTATVEDLYRAPDDGKYELIEGRLVGMSPVGVRPGHVAGNIFFYLKLYERETGLGYAFGDNVGLVANLANRQSFSPDAAYAFDVSLDSDDFASGAPDFAVEVRSKGDYGPEIDAA